MRWILNDKPNGNAVTVYEACYTMQVLRMQFNLDVGPVVPKVVMGEKIDVYSFSLPRKTCVYHAI